MRRAERLLAATTVMLSGLLGLPGSLVAQATNSGAGGAGETEADTSIVLRREVFNYPSSGRQDPFQAPDASSVLGPRFEDLELSGVIYSPDAGSMAVLVDRTSLKRYRVWEGDLVGDARLVEVRPSEAVFRVTVFGVSRTEILHVKSQEKEPGG
ncbi:MAG: hypothetical protein ACE5HF_00110 [Gemmatimonadota bacterium]